MNSKLLTALLAIPASIVAQAPIAGAFTWNNAWTQPTIQSQSASPIPFDHTLYQQFVQGEGLKLNLAGLEALDLSNLNIVSDYEVKTYFINEAASYRNQLAFRSTGATNSDGLIFNDISCGTTDTNGATCPGSFDGGDAVWGNTLNFGDFATTGLIKAGSKLNFGLRADGLNRGDNAYVFGTQPTENADGLQHAVAYVLGDYLVMGFEDFYGSGPDRQGKFFEPSDRDFNDTVFVVDIGRENLRRFVEPTNTAIPEPGTLAAIGFTALAGLRGLGRRLAHQG
jgi:hypothetical protein